MLPGWCSGKGSACQWGDMPMSKRCIFNPWIKKIPWRRKWQPTPIFFFFFFLFTDFYFYLFIYFYFTILYWFCHTSTCIRHGCNVFPILNPPPTSLRIPSLWGIPVHQPQASCILYSCLENCMDRGARWCTVRVVTESQRRLSDWMRARAHTHTHTHYFFVFLIPISYG